MVQYARVVNDIVAEVFSLPSGFTIAECFNAGIPGTWVECDGTPGVESNWTYNGTAFAAPTGMPAA